MRPSPEQLASVPLLASLTPEQLDAVATLTELRQEEAGTVLIGGGPTFVGTIIGHSWTSENLSIAFFTLAAGSILYVVIELLNVCRTFSSKALTSWGVVLGLTLGFATDFVLHASGV